MPEIGPSGLEGGVALTRHPYPYRERRPVGPPLASICGSPIRRTHLMGVLGDERIYVLTPLAFSICDLAGQA